MPNLKNPNDYISVMTPKEIYEDYIKTRISQGQCPSCSGTITINTDRSTGDKIASCGRCGYTKLL